jgi:hypothetical protein
MYIKVIELADRWGIKPYQFRAHAVRPIPDEENAIIEYISCELAISDHFNQMLSTLGLSLSEAKMKGTPKDIITRLEAALAIAPHHRAR